MKVYVIRHIDEKQRYWCRGKGWSEQSDATEFDVNDIHKLPLPPFGVWEKVDSAIPRRTGA